MKLRKERADRKTLSQTQYFEGLTIKKQIIKVKSSQ